MCGSIGRRSLGTGVEKPGGASGEGTALRVAVALDPGVVRIGSLAARNGSIVEVEFSRRQQYTLAVGACVHVGLHRDGGHTTPNQPATVMARSDRRGARRYCFLLYDGAGEDHRIVANRPAPKLQPVPVELHFGQLKLAATLTDWYSHGIQLRVTREVEAKLCSADALELVFRSSDAHPEGRLIGWIERRALDGDHVSYDFRIDERLSDNSASQCARLRSFAASTLEAADSGRRTESMTSQEGS